MYYEKLKLLLISMIFFIVFIIILVLNISISIFIFLFHQLDSFFMKKLKDYNKSDEMNKNCV